MRATRSAPTGRRSASIVHQMLSVTNHIRLARVLLPLHKVLRAYDAWRAAVESSTLSKRLDSSAVATLEKLVGWKETLSLGRVTA